MKETMTEWTWSFFCQINSYCFSFLSYTFQTVFANLYDKTRTGTVHGRHVKETMINSGLGHFFARSTPTSSLSCHTHFKQCLQICMTRQGVE